jgi:hypothetical protein
MLNLFQVDPNQNMTTGYQKEAFKRIPVAYEAFGSCPYEVIYSNSSGSLLRIKLILQEAGSQLFGGRHERNSLIFLEAHSLLGSEGM